MALTLFSLGSGSKFGLPSNHSLLAPRSFDDCCRLLLRPPRLFCCFDPGRDEDLLDGAGEADMDVEITQSSSSSSSSKDAAPAGFLSDRFFSRSPNRFSCQAALE